MGKKKKEKASLILLNLAWEVIQFHILYLEPQINTFSTPQKKNRSEKPQSTPLTIIVSVLPAKYSNML